MTAVTAFWVVFVATLVLLVVSMASGLSGRRRLHLWTGPLTIVGLVVAVVLTERLAASYTFQEDVKRIHLIVAKVGGFSALPVILTGIWLWRSESGRLWHKLAVWWFVLAALAATGTGLWMYSGAVPR
jgi:hypothetical protein